MKALIHTSVLKKPHVIIGFAILLAACESKSNQDPTFSIDITSEMVNPKYYLAARSQEPLVIDGIADEAAWKAASFSDLFIDIEGEKTPKYETKMKMLWDDNYLYVYATLDEPHIWGDIKQRDAVIFYNNDFEVFIDPSGTTKNYGEIEINALGTVWDLHLDQPYRSIGRANNHWNLDELKAAVNIVGTLNNPNDIDSRWSVEMAIPMKALAEFKNSPGPLPAEGEHWRINFSRVEWDHDIIDGVYQRKKDENNKYQPEYNWVWSNQNVINMHEPEKWGVLQFTNEFSQDGASIIEDKYLNTKQIAYTLFRQTKNGKLKELLEMRTGEEATVNVKYTPTDSLQAFFNKTLFGFEYEIPSKEIKFLINETGTLKKIE